MAWDGNSTVLNCIALFNQIRNAPLGGYAQVNPSEGVTLTSLFTGGSSVVGHPLRSSLGVLGGPLLGPLGGSSLKGPAWDALVGESFLGGSSFGGALFGDPPWGFRVGASFLGSLPWGPP